MCYFETKATSANTRKPKSPNEIHFALSPPTKTYVRYTDMLFTIIVTARQTH